MTRLKGFIFDLDGVIVDTARFHYQAWNRLARSLNFCLTLEQNELLKGVSRRDSLNILLGIGGICANDEQKNAWEEKKNAWYVDLIAHMGSDDSLPNVKKFIQQARKAGIRTAIGSASKNTPMILRSLGISELFDAVIDGNRTSRAKPDPEVFMLAAEALGCDPNTCVVFEDAAAGIDAARTAGMPCVGIGKPKQLFHADIVVRGFEGISPQTIIKQLCN